MWRVVLVLIAGCGRVAFEESAPDAEPSSGTAFRDLCGFDRIAIVENGLPNDDTVGANLASMVAAHCGSAAVTRAVSQDDPGVLDPANNRPLIPANELAVIGGGDGPNRGLAYLLRADTPVVWTGSAMASYRERATGRLIVEGSTSSTHDYALVMVVREPIGGGRILSASGMMARGTVAAGYWFATAIGPTITTNTTTWTLVEWTNTDADPAPTAGDQFVVIASGS